MPSPDIQKDIRFQKRLGLGLTLAGLVALCVGFFTYQTTRRFCATASRAAGKIVVLEKVEFDRKTTMYPVFSFLDSNGNSNVVRCASGYPLKGWTLARRHKVGDTVEVLYSSRDPDSALLNEFLAVWGWTVLFAGGGLLLASCGGILWYWSVHWRKEVFGNPSA